MGIFTPGILFSSSSTQLMPPIMPLNKIPMAFFSPPTRMVHAANIPTATPASRAISPRGDVLSTMSRAAWASFNPLVATVWALVTTVCRTVPAAWIFVAIALAMVALWKMAMAVARPRIMGISVFIFAAIQSMPWASSSTAHTTGVKKGASAPRVLCTIPAKDSSTVMAGLRTLMMSSPKSFQPRLTARERASACGFRLFFNPSNPSPTFPAMDCAALSKGAFRFTDCAAVFWVEASSSPIRSAALWTAPAIWSAAAVIRPRIRSIRSSTASCRSYCVSVSAAFIFSFTSFFPVKKQPPQKAVAF